MHVPDLSKMPKTLAGCPWQLVTPETEYLNGSQYLLAIPVRSSGKLHYEFALVTVKCDEGYFRMEVEWKGS